MVCSLGSLKHLFHNLVILRNGYFSKHISFIEAGKAIFGRGGDIFQAVQLLDHGLWDHPTMDPDSCGVIAGFAPIGPWPQSEYSSLYFLPLATTLQRH